MTTMLYRVGFAWCSALAMGVITRAAAPVVPLEIPQLADDRLQIALYAEAPQIVTPIGAAVDARGRLFVLESHTHLAPKNYTGPKRDRILIFEGAGSDGRAAKTSVFADDVLEGMNLAFSPDGTLHVVTAKTVEALPDRDGDGRADAAKVVLRLETEEKYPHNQLLGLTISHDGWIYASRGNTGGNPHAWVGADGRRLEAYGNGGDIVRCRLDGSQLERFAEGFWNPFDLKFDRYGRLLGVDNDPDSRGPNRLLHLVRGGDYGFKSLYGPSGLHPYDAWDGELPGTLPMMAGIGESPSGVIDLSYTALPPEYRDAIAATIWAEHTIPIYRTKASGVSQRATSEPFIRGGRWFRPVALATAPDGALFITDWVLKDYPNHGQGRIWKVTAKPGVKTMQPVAAFAPPEKNEERERLDSLMVAGPAQLAAVRAALKSEDPFLRHAAVVALASPPMRETAVLELDSDEADLRLGALLALRRANVPEMEKHVRPRLEDRDERVRLMALIWTGEKEARSLAPEVEAMAGSADFTARLFETWLATQQILSTPPPAPGAKPVRGFAIKRDLDVRILERVLADEKHPATVRAFALRRLVGRSGTAHRDLLLGMAKRGDPELRVEAIRTAAAKIDDETQATFREIALDQSAPSRVRAEAIAALGGGADTVLRPLLMDSDPAVKMQAERTLRVSQNAAAPVAVPAASDTNAWVNVLAKGGDADAGARVFFAPTSTCVQCHRVNGRGGAIGPDLSLIGRTSARERLVRSIVAPSEDMSPQYQGWEIRTKAGETLTGLQGHLRTDGGATLLSFDGQEIKLSGDQVQSFRALDRSLMPEGLAALHSVEELRDLVTFLEGLR